MNTQPIREYEDLVEDFVAAYGSHRPDLAAKTLMLMLRIAHERGYRAGMEDSQAMWRKAIGDVH